MLDGNEMKNFSGKYQTINIEKRNEIKNSQFQEMDSKELILAHLKIWKIFDISIWLTTQSTKSQKFFWQYDKIKNTCSKLLQNVNDSWNKLFEEFVTFVVARNKIKSFGELSIFELSKLRRLNLSNNFLDVLYPKSFGYLVALENLSPSENKLTIL